MKKYQGKWLYVLMAVGLLLLFSISAEAAEKKEKDKEFSLPDNVISIAKSNTFPNITENDALMEPSEETSALLETSKIPVKNPELIAMLNETAIHPSPIGIGYRASIYLGRWPLQYKSEHTSVNWDYQEINENELNNKNGSDVEKLQYHQQEEKEVKGALTNKITDSDMIKKMILEASKQKSQLPLSFTTKIGKNTKLDRYYNVQGDQAGYLSAYAPAINEKGKVTFGEVYVQLQGTRKELMIKNVSKQGIGAWIPIQDHVALSFQIDEKE